MITYPETAVLTAAQVKDALQVSLPTVNRMDYIPWFYIGKRSKRVVWGTLLRVLQARGERAA